MSSHRSRIAPSNSNSSLGMVPQAPPPPTISRRTSGVASRSSRRSRSRSRSPSNRGSRYTHDSTRLRDHERSRKKSPSPYRGSASTEQFRNSQNQNSHSMIQSQSISLIAGAALPIVRRILNPEDVRIPRRPREGAIPIFEREELKEAMLRRMRSDDNDENPANSIVTQPPSQQRVIAIIREPANLPIDSYRMSMMKKEPSPTYVSRESRHLREPSPQQHSRRPITAGSSNYRDNRRSVSPAVASRDRTRRSSMDRSSDRKRDLLYERETRDKQVDLLDERSRAHDIKIKTRPGSGSRSKDRERMMERGRTFDNSHSSATSRPRSRSPVRILRDRPERSGSRSITPPPMPPEIRRQMLERERDLRSKLSRPMGKFQNRFDNEHDHRDRDSGSFRGSRGGYVRGMPGGPRGRGFSTRGRSRGGVWEHDLYERDGMDGPARDLKPSTS